MNVREVQYAIEAEVHRLAVLEDLIAYLQERTIPSPVGEGVVPATHMQYVSKLLLEEQRRCETRVADLEELDVVRPKHGNVIALDGRRGQDA